MSAAQSDPRGVGGASVPDKWVIVLAGGSGRRLGALATDRAGRRVPKQYCALRGERSLLQMTLARAARAVPPQRHVVVVDRSHEQWWSRELAALPPENVVVQPADRGTAVGLFLPLARIHRRDPRAEVIVLPSDHYITREDVFAEGLESACREISDRPGRIVLLGVRPLRANSGLGWIRPGASTGGRTQPVAGFHEKPDEKRARRLLEQGAVISCLILVARLEELLRFFGRHSDLPEQFRALPDTGEATSEELAKLYGELPYLDMSTDLLQQAAKELRVLPLGDCGWMDLGTVRRVRECLLRNRPQQLPSLTGCPAPVDLSAVQESEQLDPPISREELIHFVEML